MDPGGVKLLDRMAPWHGSPAGKSGHRTWELRSVRGLRSGREAVSVGRRACWPRCGFG